MKFDKINEYEDFSQICKECKQKYPQLDPYLDDKEMSCADYEGFATVLCGVMGCKNEAYYYIDFLDNKI